MTKQRMIRSIIWKKGKMEDGGCVPMTKHEIKCFDDFEKRRKAGKEISYSFEPIHLMSKLSVHVKKDRRGNVTVYIRQPKKGECHHFECTKKTVKDYVLCKKHLRKKK